MEAEHSVASTVEINRKSDSEKKSFDDLVYMIIGDATAGNILMMVIAMMIFSAAPLTMLLFFGTYSGGMRWIIVLVLISAMAVLALALMRRGLARQSGREVRAKAKKTYPGELTGLTEAFARAADGYIYSQQLIRERICDIAIDKIALAKDLDRETIAEMLEKGNADCADDRFIGLFLLANRRGAQSFDEARAAGKGRSKERGEKFMIEIDEVLKHVEAMT